MSDYLLCYSDTHLRSTGSFPPYNVVTDSGFTKELENIIAGFKFVSNQILEYKPKLVFNCGDTFHNTEYISSMTLHGAAVALEMVSQACLEVGARHVIFAGNHDILIQDETKIITSIAPLKGYGEIVLREQIYDLDGFKIGIVPYNSDHEKAYSQLIRLQGECNLLVTHLDFCGAMYDTGRISESKIDANFDVPVISGDLHTKQEIGSVAYVGSLVQHKFNKWNLNQAGGILLFNLDDKKMRRVRNTFSKHYVKLDFDKQPDKKVPFSPDEVVLQVFSEQLEEEIAPHLNGFEYFYIKKFAEKTDQEREVEINMESPTRLLRDYVQLNNPEAVEQVDRVLRDGQN